MSGHDKNLYVSLNNSFKRMHMFGCSCMCHIWGICTYWRGHTRCFQSIYFIYATPEYPSSMLNAQLSLLTKLSIVDLIIQCIAATATAAAAAAVHADCAAANCAAAALVTTHSLSFIKAIARVGGGSLPITGDLALPWP